MLSKKEWASQYIISEKYKRVVECIENFPYPDYRATFTPLDELEHPTITRQRLKFYMKKIIPLTAFYYIDYIDNQTGGEEIINVCDSDNMFAGMYNIKTWDGKNSFYNLLPLPAQNAIAAHNNKYDNLICVCEPSCTTLNDLGGLLTGLSNTIKRNKVGYVYFAFDSHQARRSTSGTISINFELHKYYRLNQFIDDTVYNALRKCDIISYENVIQDVDDDDDSIDSIDGDVRILFKTRPSAEV